MAARRWTALVLSLVAMVALAGCSNLQGTNGKEYIDGKGQILQIDPADRGAPVEATGTDLDGQPLDLADYRGKVVMLNVWASWCPPCRAEMPTVESLAQGFDPSQVQVLGINIRQTGGTAAAQTFVADHGLSFPSFYDPSSSVLLALSGKLGPYSLPSTVVLDRQGRMAALVLGEIPGQTTMREVVQQVADEPSAQAGGAHG